MESRGRAYSAGEIRADLLTDASYGSLNLKPGSPMREFVSKKTGLPAGPRMKS